MILEFHWEYTLADYFLRLFLINMEFPSVLLARFYQITEELMSQRLSHIASLSTIQKTFWLYFLLQMAHELQERPYIVFQVYEVYWQHSRQQVCANDDNYEQLLF